VIPGIVSLILLVVGLLVALLAIGFALNWLYFRLRRRRAEQCAALAAAHVGMARRDEREPGVPVWHGQALGQPVVVAAHAWGELDERGPHFTSYGFPMVVVAAPLALPLPMRFVLSTARGARSTVRLGDFAFDQHFQIDAADSDPLTRLLDSPDLRRAIVALRGPSTFWSGSGRIVEITQHGVMVRETIPGRRKTQALAAEVAAVAIALRNRASFLG
jgi:hypothetical protein